MRNSGRCADYMSRQQPNPTTQAASTEFWIKLILSYARHRRLFFLRVEDTEAKGGDWDEVLRNERINRESSIQDGPKGGLTIQTDRLLPSFLTFLIESLVAKGLAAYEPAKQTQAVLLYWRSPEEWGEVLHDWVR